MAGLEATAVAHSFRDLFQNQKKQPLLDAPPPVHSYAPGSWGPDAAQSLVAGHGRWHGPWIAS